MSSISNEKKSDLLKFLNHELQLAYERNKEVGGYQKGTMRLLFGFYALILGATVFKGPETGQYLSQLNLRGYLVPFLVLLVGLAFAVMYFNYEIYTKIYKACMRDLEYAIYDLLFQNGSNFTKYKVTYYANPNGHPRFVRIELDFDAGFKFAMFISVVMNHGVAILVLHLISTPLKQVMCWVAVSLLIHTIVLVYLYQRKKYTHRAVLSKSSESGEE
ncbi:hypothetical protein ES703_34847 [subsurface metagenome]